MDALARFAKLVAGEPAVRADGRCSVCNHQRRPERSARYAPGCAAIDPFCSADCARRYHNNTLPPRTSHGRPTKVLLCGTSGAYKQGCRCGACKATQVAYGRAKRARERERTHA